MLHANTCYAFFELYPNDFTATQQKILLVLVFLLLYFSSWNGSSATQSRRLVANSTSSFGSRSDNLWEAISEVSEAQSSLAHLEIYVGTPTTPCDVLQLLRDPLQQLQEGLLCVLGIPLWIHRKPDVVGSGCSLRYHSSPNTC